jgi:hypothetical protein
MIRAIKLRNCDRLQLISDYNVLCRVNGKDLGRVAVMAKLGILKEVESALKEDVKVNAFV